ncbi:hypothetical protein [Phenylobacterium sp.]|uniref:hypothetical protein n=1 Tax=Phenylobacterium sp. TaxID=1871053 RepID=UPI0035669AA7
MRPSTNVGRLGLAGAPAQAQTRAPILVRAEQCLRQNVDHVVAAEHDLQSAASFLVTYACAAEVAGAARYQRNTAYVQMFSSIFKTVALAAVPGKPPAANPPAAPLPAMDFKASVDPETGEIVIPPAAPGAPANPVATMLPMMGSLFGQVAPEAVPVDLRKLAGQLVLAAQERQAGKAH